jgi:sensor c-di-GMP phosphodiesterase-like protein
MYSNSPRPMPLDLMLADEVVEQDGFLYLPMCSDKRPDCVLTAVPMVTVWGGNRGLMAGAFAVGAALGLALAVIVWQGHRRKRSMANQLRLALKKKKLWVVYQPVVNVHSNDIIGCEALVRWRDDHQRQVRPEIFVGVAEEEGFIGELTMFVLERTLTEIGDLLREKENFHVSINLSPKDLMDEAFLPRLDALMESSKVPASRVGLELTERSTTDKHVAIEVIRKLRDRGHVMYIDDFGTGYSSLSYLHELSVDVLKIDRVFTNTIGTDSITASIVPQILSMAQTMKLKVVVEGVEHQAQADYLMKFGGETAAQGWLYGRPVTAETLRSWLTDQEIAERKETLAVG